MFTLMGWLGDEYIELFPLLFSLYHVIAKAKFMKEYMQLNVKRTLLYLNIYFSL